MPEENKRWKTEYQSVQFSIEPMVVRVKNNEELKKYLRFRLKNAIRLSRVIRKRYEKNMQQPLNITTPSLAIEILGHFMIQEVCLALKKITDKVPWNGPVSRFCDWLLIHMDVIDCGEKSCDNNRFLWDLLAIPLSYRKSNKN